MIQYGGIWLNEPLAAVAQAAAQIPPERAFDFSRWPVLTNPDLNPRVDLQWFLSRGVRIGCYFNPWGASRFGYAHVIVDQTMLNSIRQQAYAGGSYTSLPFTIADNVGGTMTTDLWVLPAVPLQAIDTNFNVYLLPLVDDRFFWWEISSDTLIIDEGTTTWEEWYALLADAIDIDLSVDPVAAAYLFPSAGLAQQVRLPFAQGAVFWQGPENTTDATTTNGPYNYLPMLLDATAAACGQRIVRTTDGEYYARNALSATAIVASQALTYEKIAGGAYKLSADAMSNTPANVSVAFPMAINGFPTTGMYAIKKPTGAGYDSTSRFDSTAVALMDSPTSSSPSNNSELESLAEKIGLDFWAWRSVAYEVRYNSVIPWLSDGIHDVEWIHAGTIITAISRSAWTPNVGVFRHASDTSGSSDDWWPQEGPTIQLVDGIAHVTASGTYFDAWLLTRDNS